MLATSLRAGVIKVLLNTNPEEPLESFHSLKFNTVKTFNQNTEFGFEVFHPDGGEVEYSEIFSEFMADNKLGIPHFNDNFKVQGIESDEPELMVFVPNIKKETCEQLITDVRSSETGKKLKYRPIIPKLLSDQSALYNQEKFVGNEHNEPSANPVFLDHPDLLSNVYSCFLSNDGQTYVFYSVIFGR